MIWNYIFEFYVMYLFGGVIQQDGIPSYYGGTLGYAVNNLNNALDYENNVDFRALDFVSSSGTPYSMPLGNYLSLVATIITMGLILYFCIWLVRWVYKTVVSAFLLK